jgi:mono/diheme cytochrome c family protein
MDEIWVRIGLVAGALIVAGAVTAVLRARARQRPVREVDAAEFEPGVYLFASSTCASCHMARVKLDAALGVDGYVEMAWERDPGVFTALEVEAVPAVMIVSAGGRGRIFPGQPDKALETV